MKIETGEEYQAAVAELDNLWKKISEFEARVTELVDGIEGYERVRWPFPSEGPRVPAP